jgi:hypothetical protein
MRIYDYLAGQKNDVNNKWPSGKPYVAQPPGWLMGTEADKVLVMRFRWLPSIRIAKVHSGFIIVAARKCCLVDRYELETETIEIMA